MENLRTRICEAFTDVPSILTENQAVDLLQAVSPETLRLWRFGRSHKRQDIAHGPRFLKMGRRVAYLRSDLIDWLVEQVSPLGAVSEEEAT